MNRGSEDVDEPRRATQYLGGFHLWHVIEERLQPSAGMAEPHGKMARVDRRT